MIVSASYKTDIPAFFGPWFRARLAVGRVRVKNPYGGPDREVSLASGDVDAFVFWTRNAGPFFPILEDLAAAKVPFVVQFTVIGYPRAIETATIAAEAAAAQIRALAGRFGRRAVVWRYDPVLATSLTPPDWHADNFAGIARALVGTVDEVVLSFAQIYAKTRRNLATAAAEHGFFWDDPPPAAKAALLSRLAAIACDHGLKPSLCGQDELVAPPLGEARCIDLARLSDVAGRPIAAPAKPHRKCACAASVDIGGYDTCPHGCTYCYAVRTRDVAKRKYAAHQVSDDAL
jgi:hypothetical protein